METVVSVGIGAKYRVGVSKTNEKWSTWPGLSEPQTFKNISDIFDKHGPLCGDQYIFEVFDSEDNRIFMAEFDAKSKCPADGYASDKMVCTSFSYLFELPERLQPLAKKALEAHLAKVA
jgi:hypothetical protein